MQTEPTKEHQWLQQLVGTWTFEGTCSMGPEQPPGKTKGRETVRSLGGLWVVVDGQVEMPGGGTMDMVIQIGFDPAVGRYKGTFIGSPMPMLWLYEGSVDPTGRILTLAARGPSMTVEGGMADYQDVTEILGPDRRRFCSRIQMPDGSWYEFMSADYRRTA